MPVPSAQQVDPPTDGRSEGRSNGRPEGSAGRPEGIPEGRPDPRVDGRVDGRIDGRSARRERGRQAVIDAVVELLHQGHAPPPTALVTEQAGVSEATLFRYFESIAELQFQATTRFLATHQHLFDIPNEGVGPLSRRIDRFVTARSALWEAIAPVARLGRARAFDHPGMRTLLADARRNQAAQVARHFETELGPLTPSAREDLVASVTVLTAFESWDTQRSDLERTPTQIRRTWRTALHALLGA